MLNEYLSVVNEQVKLAESKASFINLLSQLPFEELDQIHRTGEIKLAFFDSCVSPSAGSPKSWLDCFKGSPFMEQAIALEQEELQAQMAQQQAQQVERQKNQMSWDQMDQIRLKKRLLELQKAKAESQTLQQAGVVTSQTLQPDAQGAGAAPTAPEGPDTQMASKVGMDMNLMSNLKGVAGAGPKLQGQLSNVGQHLTGSAAGQVKSMARKGTLLQGAPPPRQMIQPLAVEKDPFAKAAGAKKTAGEFLSGPTYLHTLLNPLPGSGWGAGFAGALTEPGQENAALRGAGIGALSGGVLSGIPAAGQLMNHGVDPKLSLLGIPLAALGGATGGAHAGHVAGKEPQSKATAKKKHAAVSFEQADAWGRELARADMEKAASAAYVNQVGQRAGELLAKTALAISPEVMTGIANFAKKNKGALIGAGVGAAGEAAHMAMDDEHHGLVGGAGRILGAGALGGAAGHAAEHIGTAMHGGQTLGAATKGYGADIKKKFMSLTDKVRSGGPTPTPPPPVEAMP